MSPIIKSYVESFEESNGKAMRWLLSNKKNSSHFTLDVMDCNSNKILVFDVVNTFSFYLPKRIFLIKLRIWSRVNKKIKANFVDSSINSDIKNKKILKRNHFHPTISRDILIPSISDYFRGVRNKIKCSILN